MEEVLSVYERPYDAKYPQVCLDEIHKDLRSTPRGKIPMQPGKVEREDYEYERKGTCALFLAVEPLGGYRKVWVREQRRKVDFAVILKELVDDIYPVADINIVTEKVAAWELHRNQKQVGIDWRFTNNDARCKLKRLYPVVNLQDPA